jgi:hypothetical protein
MAHDLLGCLVSAALNSLGNVEIVTQKVNLARLTELAIHQSKVGKTRGHLYDTTPRAVTIYCLGKGTKGSYCCTFTGVSLYGDLQGVL